MQMYANELQPYVLPVSIESELLTVKDRSVPAVDAVVTCSEDKKQLALALVNRDPQKEAECSISIADINNVAEAIVLSGDSTEAYNDIDNPNRVVPKIEKLRIKNGKITIPAHSLLIVKLTR